MRFLVLHGISITSCLTQIPSSSKTLHTCTTGNTRTGTTRRLDLRSYNLADLGFKCQIVANSEVNRFDDYIADKFSL